MTPRLAVLVSPSQMSTFYVNFAASGNPNYHSPGNRTNQTVLWPAYETSTDATVVLDLPVSTTSGLKGSAPPRLHAGVSALTRRLWQGSLRCQSAACCFPLFRGGRGSVPLTQMPPVAGLGPRRTLCSQPRSATSGTRSQWSPPLCSGERADGEQRSCCKPPVAPRNIVLLRAPLMG